MLQMIEILVLLAFLLAGALLSAIVPMRVPLFMKL